MNRYVCIHGHFYQPPRENPWLDEVELQDSAYPHHDWNERIAVQCYAANRATYVLVPAKRIFNNYEKINFNFGPTLLAWMEQHDPETYKAIIDADKKRFRQTGHGAALAQPYHHMIMPLANRRGKLTQIRWGISDFKHRFGRTPEGMWLPETAVDTETLELMVEEGIRFTILGPHQVDKVRRLGSKKWTQATETSLDIKMPYLYKLPSGNNIIIFFYNAPISHDIAFGTLLVDGRHFAERLLSEFSKEADLPELVHIATDGETFGHHHLLGDMGLAYCIHYLESNKLVNITTYSEFLALRPPSCEVALVENSSWSCSHGVERWRSDCGCRIGIVPAWTQKWRSPLRESLDWLRGNLAGIYEKYMGEFVKDVWSLRDDYVDVLLERSLESKNRFLSSHGLGRANGADKIKIFKLLEIERHAMLMYTSCAWFFDELSGIETIQVMQFAARAIQLAMELTNVDFEAEFTKRLKKAPSNIPDFGDGGRIYEIFIQPSVADILRVAAHYAISSIFEERKKNKLEREYRAYTAERKAYDCETKNNHRMATGNLLLRSNITLESKEIDFVVLSEGGMNLFAAVAASADRRSFNTFCKSARSLFDKGDFGKVKDEVSKYFGGNIYSLKHLFKDRQREILNMLFYENAEKTEDALRYFHERHYPVLQTGASVFNPLLRYFRDNLTFLINTALSHLFSAEGDVDTDRLNSLIEEAEKRRIELDKTAMAFTAARKIDKLFGEWAKRPDSLEPLNEIIYLIETLKRLTLDMNLRKTQNMYYLLGEELYLDRLKKAESGNEHARQWLELFKRLGKHIDMDIEKISYAVDTQERKR